MSIKLRDLIRSVRACKTAAEERAVITKECALIRTAIKEEDDQVRHRNVAKLMYIHMLGYPTHFGQMECLKLVSAVSFPEKRIGYLGLTLLLSETAEVLPMVTNSLKLDLTNNNQFIQALSLITIGNLATQDMARDLISDVEKILKGNNAYLKKKAALATIRLLKKEPDLIEHITERIAPLLKDRSHGVLISGLQLITDIFEVCPEQKDEFRKIVPSLVRLLKNFLSMGFSPEHDVGGITDPFMQVKLLNLLRLLGNGDSEASELMNDVLAQVATNTESAKNSGNAILYECVKTIMGVESDGGLRTLAINILGRFLLNRDNNIRYVALHSLTKVIHEDNAAVQRHRNTIVECLKDPDISIRQRALELVYQLVNESNVEALTAELLNYLVVCSADVKSSLVSHIITIVENYSPSTKWRVNTLISMMSMAGRQADDQVVSTCILFLSQQENLHGYVVHKLYRSLLEDSSQLGFLHVGIWCIGEYSDLLLSQCAASEDHDAPASGYSAVSESEVIATLAKFAKLHNADSTTKALVLNALVKLTVQCTPVSQSQIQAVIEPFRRSMNLELQQRSSEYNQLLGNPNWSELRTELLAKMPVADVVDMRRRRGSVEPGGIPGASPMSPGMTSMALGNVLDMEDTFGLGSGSGSVGSVGSVPASSTATVSAAAPSMDNDLMDIFGMSSTTSASVVPAVNDSNSSMDIFGSSAPAAVPAAVPVANNNNIMDLFGSTTASSPPTAPMPVAVAPAPAPVSATVPSNDLMGLTMAPSPTASVDPVVSAYDKSGLKITMHCSKPDPSNPATTLIVCKFSNANQLTISSLSFQAAVPKYIKLEMFPPSSTSVSGNSNGTVTQNIKLNNQSQGEKNIVLKLKISYVIGGKKVEDMTSVSSFPALY